MQSEYQQHGWYMTDTSGTLQQQLQRIYSRIDWLMEAGFEFLSSERLHLSLSLSLSLSLYSETCC
jgi:hypothetical protein